MKNLQSLLLKHWFSISIFILLMSYFVAKILQLNLPISLYWDEVAMLVDAKSIAETGKDMHGNSWFQSIFPSYGDYKLPIYIWSASLLVKLLGVSACSFRMVSVIAGFIEILVLCILTPKLLKISTTKEKQLMQIVTLFTIITMPWFFHFSGVGFEGFIGQTFVCLSVLFAILAKEKKLFWLLVVITGVLGVYSYYSVRFVWPVVILCLGFLQSNLVFAFPNFKEIMRSLLFPILSIFFWFLLLIPLSSSRYYLASQTFRLSTPSVINDDSFVLQSNVMREQAGNSVLSRVIYHRNILRLKTLLAHYSQHLSFEYLFLSGDPNLRHGTGNSGLLLLASILPFLYAFQQLAVKNKTLLFFLLIWWMVGLLPASVPMNTPHALRSLNALPPIVIMTSFGLYLIGKEILWGRKRSITFLLAFLTLIFILLNATVFFHDYFRHYPSRSAKEWQVGYTELAEFMSTFKTDKQVYVNTGDDRFYLWYLAYSQIQSEDIQKYVFEDFKLKEIDNIHFISVDENTLRSEKESIIVITRPGNFMIQPTKKHEIIDPFGSIQFEAGEYAE